jgi:hypothetical protein
MEIDYEFIAELKLLIHRALIGMIIPEMRAIGYKLENNNKRLTLICYYDRETNEDDLEDLKDITGEVCADIYPRVDEYEEICEYATLPIYELDKSYTYVYKRKEKF